MQPPATLQYLKKYDYLSNNWPETFNTLSSGSAAAVGNGKYRIAGSGIYQETIDPVANWTGGLYNPPHSGMATNWTGIVYHNSVLVLAGTTLDNGSTDFYSTGDEWGHSVIASFSGYKPVNAIAATQ